MEAGLVSMTDGATKIWSAVLGVLALIMALATAQMFSAQSRIDALYVDSGAIKADVARLVERSGQVRADLDAIRGDLNNVQSVLARIDQNVQKAALNPSPAFFPVGDRGKFKLVTGYKGYDSARRAGSVSEATLLGAIKGKGDQWLFISEE